MQGVIWSLYPEKESGLILGNDALEIPFRGSGLRGVEFRALSPGQRVTYRIQQGRFGPEAVQVRPVPTGFIDRKG